MSKWRVFACRQRHHTRAVQASTTASPGRHRGYLRRKMAERDQPAPVSQPATLLPTSAAPGDGSRAAHTLVSNLVTSTIDQAMPRIQESIMDAVEARMAGAFREQQQALSRLVQQAGPGTTTPSEGQATVSTVSTVGSSNIAVTAPAVGRLPNPSLISNVPSFASAAGPSGAVSPSVCATLLPSTPLASLVPHTDSIQERTADAVLIGCSSPPIPRKLAERAWGGEYVDLAELSPVRLGTPEPIYPPGAFAGNTLRYL